VVKERVVEIIDFTLSEKYWNLHVYNGLLSMLFDLFHTLGYCPFHPFKVGLGIFIFSFNRSRVVVPVSLYSTFVWD
jgi:hypothetical protein